MDKIKLNKEFKYIEEVNLIDIITFLNKGIGIVPVSLLYNNGLYILVYCELTPRKIIP